MSRAAPFDLMTAIRRVDEDPLSVNWRTSAERVASDAAAERYGVSPLPARIYLDIARRNLSTSTAGALVQTSSGGIFLDSLLGASIGERLGVQTIDAGQDNRSIPVITTAPTTQWLADEDTAISTSQPVIGSRAATPKTVSAHITFSSQLLKQSNPAIQNVLFRELGRAIAAARDTALFNGSGSSGEPLGILGTDGIASASGATIAWASITDMIEDTATAGAPMVSPGFAATPAVTEILMGREVTASSGVMFTMDATRLGGYPLMSSKTGPAGALAFADWSNILFLQWGLVELAVDPYTGHRSGLISLRALLSVEIIVSHPSTIAVRTSVS